jgi:serine/threonine-protein kinase
VGKEPIVDPASEERALRQAVEDGYLTPADVEDQAQDLPRLGPRLWAFLRAGLLSRAVAERLLAAAGSGAAAASSNGHERYERGELLGEGGMGQVYRAYDTALKRPVALKFLRSDDPDRVARFLREAQAQARVDHQNVCKVYEAGELDGRPYIAMQLIQGEALPNPALDQMSVEQKVRILRDVAEAIHAAHREGLIHRDIKPSNIMLERCEGGSFKPYVLDFGLAREVASAGETSLGLAAGTPNFMAPEQARGQSTALDRRTDVYGLGATLYALLSGHPPFEGPSSLDVLMKVTEQEPPVLSGVPEDLATIITKCLQKEPGQRYDSARALAEDLGHYLDGDPIRARRTTLTYRLLKKARKHRKLVAAGTVAALLFVVLAVASVRAQLQARERTRLAGVFGQEVKGIESLMRIVHILPEHDITPEKRRIRERMRSVEEQIARIGGVAEGPGHYALGRGHLALGEYEEARTELERAWQAGYRDRDAAYALGQVMGTLYQRALEAAERVPTPNGREEKKREAERLFRDPALSYLQQSSGSEMESSEYVRALIAFYEKRYSDALEAARSAASRTPWLYEAKALEGQILVTTAADLGIRDGKYEEATTQFHQAEAAYRAAFAVGRSDATLPEGLCRMTQSFVRMRLLGQGGQLASQLRAALTTCNTAVAIDPADAMAYLEKAELLRRLAQADWESGADPRPTLAAAMDAAREALRLRPADPRGYRTIGLVLWQKGEWDTGHDVDPTEELNAGVASVQKAIALDPSDLSFPHSLALCYGELASYQNLHGLDPRPAMHRAQELYARIAALQSDYQTGNLASDYRDEAYWELRHGQDPRPNLAKARDADRRALQINPNTPYNRFRGSSIENVQAEYELLVGADPRPSIDRALQAGRSALEVNPQFRAAMDNMAHSLWLRGRWALSRGESPERDVAEGLACLRTTEGPRDHPEAPLLMLLDARWQLVRNRSPLAALESAERILQPMLRAEAAEAETYAIAAESRRLCAEWLRRRGESNAAEVARGLQYAERALTINPALADAFAARGALHLEAARAGGPRQRESAESARVSFERALAIDGLLAREHGPLLEEALRLATAKPASPRGSRGSAGS